MKPETRSVTFSLRAAAVVNVGWAGRLLKPDLVRLHVGGKRECEGDGSESSESFLHEKQQNEYE